MKKKICRLCLLTTACLVLILFSFKKSDNKPALFNPTYSLWYDQPAKVWQEALPVGNGRLGAMIFGRINKERLQLNDITIWTVNRNLRQAGLKPTKHYPKSIIQN